SAAVAWLGAGSTGCSAGKAGASLREPVHRGGRELAVLTSSGLLKRLRQARPFFPDAPAPFGLPESPAPSQATAALRYLAGERCQCTMRPAHCPVPGTLPRQGRYERSWKTPWSQACRDGRRSYGCVTQLLQLLRLKSRA